MNTVDAAKDLLGYGFHLVSLRPGSKEPAGGEGWQERAVQRAADAHKLKGGNIGVLGGSPVREGCRLLVIDIDGKNGAGGPASVRQIEAVYGSLPATATVRTPNDGYHLYYAVPADTPLCGISGLLKRLDFSGIDLIGDGLYVVAPPSVLASGPYRWTRGPDEGLALAPFWLRHLLRTGGRPGPVACIPTQRSRTPGPASRLLGPDALSRLVDEVVARFRLEGPNQRNDNMHRAVGSLFRRGLSPAQVREVMLRWHEHFDGVFQTPFAEAVCNLDQSIALTLCNIERGVFSLASPDHLAVQKGFPLTAQQRAFLDRLPVLLPSSPSLPPSPPHRKGVLNGQRTKALALTNRERQFAEILLVLAAYERAKPNREGMKPDEIRATNQQMIDLLLARHGVDLNPTSENQGAGKSQLRRLKATFVTACGRPARKVELLELTRVGERGQPSVYRLTGLLQAFGS
ncbi:MAG: bifunctional DNA primase/polymerase [Gemmataceae bacterium]|jgi:hypothetical protein|nr:bifunctional DNA primase/polymerase [Gemmataceae bacterium]